MRVPPGNKQEIDDTNFFKSASFELNALWKIQLLNLLWETWAMTWNESNGQAKLILLQTNLFKSMSSGFHKIIGCEDIHLASDSVSSVSILKTHLYIEILYKTISHFDRYLGITNRRTRDA